MSYNDDDRQDDNRDMDRRDDDREAERRYEAFKEDTKRDQERRDRDLEDALAAARKGDVVSAALRMGLSDSAVYLLERNRDRASAADQLQPQSNRDAVWQRKNQERPSTEGQTSYVDQLTALRDAMEVVFTHLNEEIMQHLDALRDTKDFAGEMAKFRELTQKRNELRQTMMRIFQEPRREDLERVRKAIQSDLESR